MEASDGLILSLAEGLKPVKRLPAPRVRALIWLGVVALLSFAFVLRFARLEMIMERARNPKLALELVGTLMTGILAVFAAFELSLPDRSRRWALLPLPSFALWLGSSGYSCWSRWISIGPDRLELGETTGCFAWIVGLGIPLAIGLFVVLRRSHPLDPGPVAAMAGLGVASLAAFLLQFFHPFDVTFIDLGLHLAGVATVVILARAMARPGLDGLGQ
jgi:hypothetical protein